MTLNPEAELLLLCAAPAKNAQIRARIAGLLSHAIDWPVLLELAESHRLLPLLYWELKSVRPRAIPPDLESAFRTNLQNSLLLTGELIRILALFESAGIDAIPFKGPTLAIRAYNNLSLRRFDDLDIILRPRDVWRARDLLASIGYTSGLQLHPARQADYIRAYDELILSGGGGSPLVELHWKFLPGHFCFPLDISQCWPRRETVLLGKQAVPALHPDDLMLVLAVHGSKHCWSYLGLICDVAWLLANDPVNWERVLRRADEMGIRRMVLLAALLASRTLGVPLAKPAAKGIEADAAIDTLAAQIVSALFGKRHDERSIRANARMHMLMRERVRDRLRYFFRLTFRPGVEDWHLIDLPRPLSFLYPVLRFPRLAFKYRSRLP